MTGPTIALFPEGAVSPYRSLSRALHPRRVLIVEDYPDGREALRLLLTVLGHEVAVAADGIEGVRLAREVCPDAALVDIGLPGLDGYEVARQIRSHLGDAVLLIAY